MPSSHGEDAHQEPQTIETEQTELVPDGGPRAERPNFLTATRFSDFDLPQEILDGLDKAGFEYCTPIQAQAIPVAMSGSDIAGQAQTGTGKTTAFLVPLLNRLLKNKPLEPGVPRAIIITPTRELALQIHEDALVLAGSTELRQVLVIGGMDYKEQADVLATGPEIIICTPGRIIDYLQQGVFKTNGIELAVVDEADRLLDMGFIKDLKYLLGKLPPFDQRQTMLFSATLDDRVLELTYQFMNPPQYITAEPDRSSKVNIVQELYHVGRDEKLPLLMGLLRREEHHRIIIFVNTKSGVEWLAKKLTMNGFQAEGITGDLPQPKRLKLMEAFKENRLQILVATDVASRGIHVDDVSHVYNYDLPQDAENYVHRIGRTARAGNTGKAVSFGCEDYVFHLEAIENLLGDKIPVFWAEQDWFHEDQGGEVRMKDRRGERDRKKSTAGGRAPAGRLSRGPAKSQRPGGIFGLSPRIGDEKAEDVRQVLTWAVTAEELPASGPEPSGQPNAEAASGGEREGRRRKRRRGRRGGGQQVAVEAVSPQAAVEAAAAEGSSQAAEQPKPSKPTVKAEPSVAEKEAKKASKASPKKTGSKKTASEVAAAPEAGGPAAPAAVDKPVTTEEKPKKSGRATGKAKTGQTGVPPAEADLEKAAKKTSVKATARKSEGDQAESEKKSGKPAARSSKKTQETAVAAVKASETTEAGPAKKRGQASVKADSANAEPKTKKPVRSTVKTAAGETGKVAKKSVTPAKTKAAEPGDKAALAGTRAKKAVSAADEKKAPEKKAAAKKEAATTKADKPGGKAKPAAKKETGESKEAAAKKTKAAAKPKSPAKTSRSKAGSEKVEA